ncbi:MAG: GAF domain-containing protein, partial [Chloroflexota bacterium]
MSNSEEETQAKSDKPDNNLNQADELQTLFNTSSRVVRQHDLKTALVEVLNGLQKLVPHDSGSVYYHRPGDEWLEPILARGQKDEVFSQVKFPYKGSLIGRALQNHQFMMHNAVATDPEAFSPTDAPPNEFSGLLVAPLLISEQDEGWTLAIRRMTAPPFTEREFKLFQIFASYAEIAIENVRLYEVALRETEALRRVYTIMSTVGSLKSSDQIYSRVADEIRLIFDYDYLLISEIEVENNLFRVIFDSGIEEWQYEQKQGSLRGSSIEQAVKTSQYLVRNDLTVPLGPIYTYEEHLLQHNIRSYAIFPMRYEGRVSRVMIVSNRQPNAFDPASVNFLEILAGQLAITAENVHLFDRLRRTRRQWQIILDSIPDAVLLLNAADLTVLQTNRAAAALAACRPDELVGRSYRDIFYQVDPCLCYFPLEELHSPGTEFTEEANGTFSGRIYQRSIYPIFDNTGTLNEVVTHIREVTETKMIEQQLAQT